MNRIDTADRFSLSHDAVESSPVIAVLIPCYNEEMAIAKVVMDFREALPSAVIYVYDNNSADKTCDVARAAGAIVRTERLQGKGNVVRRMFADIDADVYVLVDGDDTYHAASAPQLVDRLLSEKLDMVNAQRVTEIKEAYRTGHRFGNALLTGMVQRVFGKLFNDMLSGYRIFSRRYVKSFPALAKGFEIETELTVHALELRMPTLEMPTPYKDRPVGSVSKLKTYSDGWKILKTIVYLIKEERPMPFFLAIFALLLIVAGLISIPLVITYAQTGLVPRLPTAVLATGLVILAFLSLQCGVLLDSVTLGRRETKRMLYLSIPAPGN